MSTPSPGEEIERECEEAEHEGIGSVLLAHDVYWGPSNWRGIGSSTRLYRAFDGSYYRVTFERGACFAGKRDSLSQEDAYLLFESMPVREVEACEAFECISSSDA